MSAEKNWVPLTIAVPKGRILKALAPLFSRAGLDVGPLLAEDRRLVREDATGRIRYVFLKPDDVPTYVEAGAADLGITGKDVLLEQSDRAVYELADLDYGRCRMVLATQKGDTGATEHQRRLGMMRIATKYTRIAERYFESRGQQVEIVEVKGSIELAPLVGLADGIVDLVATGRTLAENNLEVREEILGSSARLVANQVSHKLRAEEIDSLAKRLREAAA